MAAASDDFKEGMRKMEEAAEALKETLKQVEASQHESQTPRGGTSDPTNNETHDPALPPPQPATNLPYRGHFPPKHPTSTSSTTETTTFPKQIPNMAEENRPSSPTPSERERLDKDAKAKEQAEQSALPYKWTQTIADLEVTAEIPANFKGKDLDVKIGRNSLKAGIKGQEPIIDVSGIA